MPRSPSGSKEQAMAREKREKAQGAQPEQTPGIPPLSFTLEPKQAEPSKPAPPKDITNTNTTSGMSKLQAAIRGRRGVDRTA